jgi:Cys-tRNA(Pro) deacylase
VAKDKFPITPAIRQLRAAGVDFKPLEFEYEEKGGTNHTAIELGVNEYSVIKTLIFNADGNLICILMHGNNEVSTKELARQINVKKIESADERSAFNSTGYQFGGTSPFAHRRIIPVFAEKTIFDLDRIYINGGKRGFIIEINPIDMFKVIKLEKVNVAI